MYLYLMQHAKANPKEQDLEEGLSQLGQIQAANMGKYLKQLNVTPDVVLVSSKKRSQETAAILLKEFQLPESFVKETETIKAKAEIHDTIDYLKTLNERSVLIVGHLPSLLALAKFLSGAEIAFQNSSCLLLQTETLEENSAQILWFIPPVS